MHATGGGEIGSTARVLRCLDGGEGRIRRVNGEEELSRRVRTVYSTIKVVKGTTSQFFWVGKILSRNARCSLMGTFNTTSSRPVLADAPIEPTSKAEGRTGRPEVTAGVIGHGRLGVGVHTTRSSVMNAICKVARSFHDTQVVHWVSIATQCSSSSVLGGH